METNETMHIDDRMLEAISGGNEAELQEIMDYIKVHDPEYYDFMTHVPATQMFLVKYLYEHGVPVVAFMDFEGSNVYILGTVDKYTGKTEESGRASHAEVMAMIREKIV